MSFLALTDTSDFRLIKGRIYHGSLVVNRNNELRVAVYDSTGEWMTFDPSAFSPVYRI